MRSVVERVLELLNVKNWSLTETLGSAAVGIDESKSKAQRNSLSKTEPGKLYPLCRIAIEKEPAAELLVRLVNRDVVAEHAGVSDEQRSRR